MAVGQPFVIGRMTCSTGCRPLDPIFLEPFISKIVGLVVSLQRNAHRRSAGLGDCPTDVVTRRRGGHSYRLTRTQTSQCEGAVRCREGLVFGGLDTHGSTGDRSVCSKDETRQRGWCSDLAFSTRGLGGARHSLS